MKILVIGNGGREHAIVWKIAQSPHATKIFAAPGNPGMAGQAECVDIGPDQLDGLLSFAEAERIDLTVVGPEAPLAAGIVDRFRERDLSIFGPTRAAAQIESDKAFALDLMDRWHIPTGRFESHTDPDAARRCLRDWGAPVVLKANGLAAGKGAVVCQTLEEAERAIDQMMVRRIFGSAGDRLVVMEYLEGEEASIFGFTDGAEIVCLVPSQDHKPVGEGDTGPNTGGMGAYAPAPVVTPDLEREIVERIVRPAVRAMACEGRPYTGILYGGIIITPEGPKVIEFNCRLGDPEAQVVLPLLKTDLVELMIAVNDGTLGDLAVEIEDGAAACVVAASGGYPGPYKTGLRVSGTEAVEALDDVALFHAGTRLEKGDLLTAGGRVLGVTAVGDEISAAIQKAYDAVQRIEFQDIYFRKDIGYRALGYLEANA